MWQEHFWRPVLRVRTRLFRRRLLHGRGGRHRQRVDGLHRLRHGRLLTQSSARICVPDQARLGFHLWRVRFKSHHLTLRSFTTVVCYIRYNLNSVLDDTIQYSFATKQWKKLSLGQENQHPKPLYGHAMAAIDSNRLALFGGAGSGHNHSSQLWMFDSDKSQWSLQADESLERPPGLAWHSLTLAGDGFLYLFGGSLESGQFSSGMFRIDSQHLGTWEQVEQFGKDIFSLSN